MLEKYHCCYAFCADAGRHQTVWRDNFLIFCQKHIKLNKVSTIFCQIVKYPFKKLYKIMPKWRNFAKSGCTDIRTNFLIIFFSKMLIKSMPMKHGWSIRICKKAFLVLVPELRRCLTRRWPTRARRSRRTGPRLLGPHPEKTIRFYEGT